MLPNLGRLDLRLRARTGADQDGDGDDDEARRVRPRFVLLNDEQRDRIRGFLEIAVRDHMGLAEADPPPSEADRDRLIAEARAAVADRHADLTEEWPDRLGDGEGDGLFPAGRPRTAEALTNKLIDLWIEGFASLDGERRHARGAVDDQMREQIKAHMRQVERREADAADDGGGYFDSRVLDRADVPQADAELKADLEKKVAPGEEQRWGEELHENGFEDRCCTGASWGRP